MTSDFTIIKFVILDYNKQQKTEKNAPPPVTTHETQDVYEGTNNPHPINIKHTTSYL